MLPGSSFQACQLACSDPPAASVAARKFSPSALAGLWRPRAAVAGRGIGGGHHVRRTSFRGMRECARGNQAVLSLA
eukprot:5111571-Pyramimonas_sp.AAC.1